MYELDISGGIYTDPDYQQSVGQVQQLQDDTQRALLDLQTNPITNLSVSNTGNNVTLAFSGGALTANLTGSFSYTLVTGLGTLATKNQATAVANLGTTISATYTQAEVQAIVTKLDALLSALRTAQIIAT